GCGGSVWVHASSGFFKLEPLLRLGGEAGSTGVSSSSFNCPNWLEERRLKPYFVLLIDFEAARNSRETRRAWQLSALSLNQRAAETRHCWKSRHGVSSRYERKPRTRVRVCPAIRG